MILPEGLAVSLENAATSAVGACNVVAAKRHKRDAGTDGMRFPHFSSLRSVTDKIEATTCMLNIITNTINDESNPLFASVSDTALETLNIDIAPAAGATIQAAWALMKTKSQKAKFALFYGSAVLAASLAMSNSAGDTSDSSTGTVGKINIPAAGVGVPIPTTKGCDGSEKLHQDSVRQIPAFLERLERKAAKLTKSSRYALTMTVTVSLLTQLVML